MSSDEPRFSYDEIADAYAAGIDSAPYNALYERPAMLSLLPPVDGARILDAGCGSGWYAEQLTAAGARVTAIDGSAAMVNYTRERLSRVEAPGGVPGSPHPGNIGPKLGPAKPQVLIYEPVGDKLVLAAAEWFVPVAAAGGTVPTIFGQTLAGPMDGHEPIMPASLRHYDLHVWLWKGNPRGVFTSTNAGLKCTPGAPYTVAIGADHH